MDDQPKPELKKAGISKEEWRFLFFLLTPPFIYGLIYDALWNEWIPKPISKAITGYFNEVFHTILGIALTVLLIGSFFLVFIGLLVIVFGNYNTRHH